MSEIREVINTATIGLHDLLGKEETIKANSNDYIIRKSEFLSNILMWFRKCEFGRLFHPRFIYF